MRERLKKNLASEREKARVAEVKMFQAITETEKADAKVHQLQDQLAELEAKRQGQIAELEAKNKHLQHSLEAANDG